MGKEIEEISVEDIIDFFGGFLDRPQAENMFRRVGSGGVLFESMHRIRSILIEQGHNVPFRAAYRRRKKI